MRGSGLVSGEHHGVRCECSVCGEVFCGVQSFDQHRVGEHGSPSRRCLTAAELGASFPRCSLGRWSTSLSLATRPESVKTAAGRIGGRTRAENARMRVAS